MAGVWWLFGLRGLEDPFAAKEKWEKSEAIAEGNKNFMSRHSVVAGVRLGFEYQKK